MSIQRIAQKAALKISTHTKAMLDNNESKKDSTHSEEVLSVTEVSETKDRSKSEVQAEPGDKSNWFGSVFGAVSASASAVGNAATSAGSAIVDTASAVGNAAGTAGSAIVDTASAVGNAAASAGSAAMQVPNFFGSSLVFISQSPILKKLTQKFKIDWLVNAIDAVDVVSAEAQVRELQRQYPHEKPEEIAHHLMVEKALLAAGSGLVSSLVPGVALALSGMDLAAITALSAELVYQIAAAYGMDLRSSDRKAEVVAIFGLSLGSNLAIEAGVALVSNIPLAGAVINASASATMIYALGYGACRFYEAHLDSSEIETKLEDLQEVLQAESEQYLETAIAQETVMDWILVYVVYASKKFTRWDELLPELRAANLNPRTLAEIEAVTNKSKLLPKLDILLAQLELDFAEPLLKRCTEMIEADGEINQQEGKILLTIQRAVLSKRKLKSQPSKLGSRMRYRHPLKHKLKSKLNHKFPLYRLILVLLII